MKTILIFKLSLFLLLTNLNVSIGAIRYFKPHIDLESFAGYIPPTVVDLNMDGNIDLVASTDSSIVYLQGDGRGSFPETVILAEGRRAELFGAFDIDGDGDLDLLGSLFRRNLGWWENDGDMNFEWHVLLEEIGRTKAIADDLDQDGDLDLIIGLYINSRIFWYENDGEQNYEGFEISHFFGIPNRFVCIDLDGDDDKDLVSIANQHLGWWENNGEQEFEAHIIHENHISGPDHMWVADLDLDGDQDIVTTIRDITREAPADTFLSWWENDGEGEFEQHLLRNEFDYEWYPVVSDIDFDGDMDIINKSRNRNSSLSLWENDGQQNFTVHTVAVQRILTWYISIEDVNSDGDLDLVGVVVPGQGLVWWEHCMNWDFTERNVSGEVGRVNHISSVDLDDDNDSDILGIGYDAETIFWWENDLENGFIEHVISENFSRPIDVISTNLNNDDNLDVLAVRGDERVYWWENDGEGNFDMHLIEGELPGKTSVCSADFDGDGDIDVAATSAWSGFGFDLYGGMTWWENNNEGEFVRHVLDENFGSGGHSISGIDLDLDGDADILASADGWWHDPGGITWWVNDGEGNFERILIWGDDCWHIQPVDFDIDGDIDILGLFGWWENDGEMNFDLHEFPQNIIDWDTISYIGSADIDSDNDLDIVTAGEFGVLYWINDGEMNFEPHDLAINNWETTCVQLEDFDNDGDPDIAASSRSGGNVVWWENSLGDMNVPARFELDIDRGWSLISAPIIPIDDNVVNLFSRLTLTDDLLLLKDSQGRFYFPEEDFNNIPAWNVEEGYQIKLDRPGVVRFQGEPVNSDHPILLSEGWSMVAYFPEREVEAPVAFANIAELLLFAKDGDGHFYAPEHNFNNIPPIHRGAGYQVKVSEEVELVWNVEEDVDARSEATKQPQRLLHFVRKDGTGSNMSVLVTDPPEEGEIAAFTSSGICVGATAFRNQKAVGLTVWGDDESTEEVDGLKEGETFKLKLWDPINETEVDISPVKILHGSGLVYETDGFTVFEANTQPTIPDQYYLIQNYPNPFNSSTAISYGLPEKSDMSIQIFDISGRLVKTLVNGKVEAGYHTMIWDASTVSTGVYLVKMELEAFRSVRKVVLVR